MIDAKLKGEGVETGEIAEAPRGNVVDLMAALKRSLGQEEGPADKAPSRAPSAKPKPDRTPASATKGSRKRA